VVALPVVVGVLLVLSGTGVAVAGRSEGRVGG
jgi:hypothetical protein